MPINVDALRSNIGVSVLLLADEAVNQTEAVSRLVIIAGAGIVISAQK